MKKNGLELISINTCSDPMPFMEFSEFYDRLGSIFTDDGFVVIYADDRVLIGRWKNSSFVFHDNKEPDPGYIQKIRIFNRSKELMAWRSGNGIRARLRRDNSDGDKTHVVVAEQLLFGTEIYKKYENFTTIGEKRGTFLTLPFVNLKIDEIHNRVFIKTHNYVDYKSSGQATYTDCRFVAFTDGRDNLP